MAGSARLVEILGSLSLATDAADGFPPETTIRTALLAAAVAQDLGDAALVSDVLYGGLIRHIGCTGFSVEEAERYGAGDDVQLRRALAAVDFGDPEDIVRNVTTRLAAHAPPNERQAAVATFLSEGPAAGAAHDRAQCDAAERLTALLPVSDGARTVASDAFERWDGSGGPAGKQGDELSLVARIVEVAYVAELFRSREGSAVAVATLEKRAGGQLDPSVARAFIARAPELFRLVDDPDCSIWDALLAAEPASPQRVSPAQVDALSLAFARFTDLKSTFFAGHSEAVATLVEAAAEAADLPTESRVALHTAALLHDIGRVAVPTGVWDLPRPLSPPERDRVRFHAWETQRILGSTTLFDGVLAVAAGAHERNDGNGYHRGLHASGLDTGTRLLAAADVATALWERRPHRPALARAEAHAALLDEVEEGRLDRSAVSAVLDAGGGPKPPALSWPAGLSDREVEVLRLVARGATNKDVARALGITAKTVAHHVAHVYTKIGCRSRAGAALFALDCGLVGPGSLPHPSK